MDLPAPSISVSAFLLRRSAICCFVLLLAVALAPTRSEGAEPPSECRSIAKVLPCDRQALQARFDLISRAQHSIDVAYYSLKTDEVGLAVLEYLRRAAVRGVRVRVLIDGVKWRLGTGGHHYLSAQGIEFALYHPPGRCSPRWLNQRLHSKLMVFDGKVAIVGSRNLENGHFGIDNERNYADCDAVVSGSVVTEAQQYFDRLWCSDEVRSPPTKSSLAMSLLNFPALGDSDYERGWRKADSCAEYQCLLDRSVERVRKCLGVTKRSAAHWISLAVCDADPCLLSDCRLDKSARRFQRKVVQLMDNAASRIVIESPYPAFDKPTRAAISRARTRGVCVTIVTNSLTNNDVPVTYAAYQNQKRSLLNQGVQLREYCGERTLHAKTMLIDDSISMIGSYNFDARSNRANLELAVVSRSPLAAQQLRANVLVRLKHTVLIDPDSLVPRVGGQSSAAKRVSLILHRAVVEAYRCLL